MFEANLCSCNLDPWGEPQASKPFWPRCWAKAVHIQTPRVQVARLRQPLGETLPPLFSRATFGGKPKRPPAPLLASPWGGVCGLNGISTGSQRADGRAQRALHGLSTGRRLGSTGRPAFKDPPAPHALVPPSPSYPKAPATHGTHTQNTHRTHTHNTPT